MIQSEVIKRKRWWREEASNIPCIAVELPSRLLYFPSLENLYPHIWPASPLVRETLKVGNKARSEDTEDNLETEN